MRRRLMMCATNKKHRTRRRMQRRSLPGRPIASVRLSTLSPDRACYRPTAPHPLDCGVLQRTRRLIPNPARPRVRRSAVVGSGMPMPLRARVARLSPEFPPSVFAVSEVAGIKSKNGGGGGNRTRVRMASNKRVYVRSPRSNSGEAVARSGRTITLSRHESYLRIRPRSARRPAF